MTLPILILAAGASRRMGGVDKLLQPVRGKPLLRDRVEAALATGAEVFVTLPEGDETRAKTMDGLQDVALIPSPNAHEGMAGSLRDGIKALPEDAQGVLVVLADMPDITTLDMQRLRAGFDGGPLRAATQDGIPGHPTLLTRELFAEIANLHGDIGARNVLKAHPPRLIPLPGTRALTDLDTPQDWADWRART